MKGCEEMAVRTREELMTMIRERIGESTDDDTIKFVEDVTDTLEDYESKTGTAAEWEKKYNENDAEWRKRYTERFFSPSPDPDPPDPADQEVPKTYEDLFTTESEVR